MSHKMHLVMVTVADLHIGDLLLLPEAAVTEPITVEVTLRRSPRSGRISVWVRSLHPRRTLDRPWRFGTFDPSASVHRIELGGKVSS